MLGASKGVSSAMGTTITSVVIPVVVAALTAAATILFTRASEAANRRRDRYAAAFQTLVSWLELPYRVRRRTSDDPETLRALVELAHDLQERMACHQAWIATENPAVANQYAETRAIVAREVGPALAEAWTLGPVTTAAGMNLGSWGPAGVCAGAMASLQHRIEDRFGFRRMKHWLHGSRRDVSSPAA